MPLTPEDVSNKRFTPVRLREGYDMGEVDQFLDEVESELARLTREQSGTPASPDGAATKEAGRDTGKDTPATPAKPATGAPSETLKVTTVADASSAAAPRHPQRR
jgi:DivIVA domain-containing protein